MQYGSSATLEFHQFVFRCRLKILAHFFQLFSENASDPRLDLPQTLFELVEFDALGDGDGGAVAGGAVDLQPAAGGAGQSAGSQATLDSSSAASHLSRSWSCNGVGSPSSRVAV